MIKTGLLSLVTKKGLDNLNLGFERDSEVPKMGLLNKFYHLRLILIKIVYHIH